MWIKEYNKATENKATTKSEISGVNNVEAPPKKNKEKSMIKIRIYWERKSLKETTTTTASLTKYL